VIIYESFKGSKPENNPILAEMVQRSGSQRRDHFVVLLSHRFATNDAMSAFVQSVDQIINVADLANLKPVLRRGIAQYRELYQSFQETLKATQAA
jgi:DNA polymerase IIIc chi subunit